MPFHPQRQRFQSTQQQPAVKRRKYRADGILQEFNLCRIFFLFCHQNSRQQIVVATQILCTAVKDDIRAKQQRFLEIRGQKCVIHNHFQVFGMRPFADCAEIRNLHGRIGRRFNIYGFCGRPVRFFHSLQIAGIHFCIGQSVFPGYCIEKTNRAAV